LTFEFNMMGKVKIIGILMVVAGVLSGCTTRAKYDRMVKEGLGSGERYDSLFLGIYLGMEQSTFYDHCMDLNKKQLVYEGGQNTTVRYNIDELSYPAEMNFYPGFYEGKIWKMLALFTYDGWAPWNRHLFSDSLQVDVLELMKNWYGEGFLEIQHPDAGSAFVKIDGNRQISIYLRDDRFVEVMFTDLIEKQKIPDDLSQEIAN